MASKKNEKLLDEAKDRFVRCWKYENDFRKRFIEDLQFTVGDSNNNYQWTESARNVRSANRPMITINKTRQHVLQIINDQRQNGMQMQIRPVNGEATYKAAEILEGTIRHIEDESKAQNVYNKAFYDAVAGGIGWWRIITDYADDDSFRQKILVERVGDPLSIYQDPDIRTADGSDANFAFVVADMPKDEFKRRYPQVKDPEYGIKSGLITDEYSEGDIGFCDEDHVRVVEYFKRYERVTDKLLKLADGTTIKQSQLDDRNMLRQIVGEMTNQEVEPTQPIITMSRDITEWVVEYYKIAGGDHIVESNTWPGSYIPLIRVVGEETNIQGEMDRRGHTRYLRGAQEIYNYYVSAAVEQVATQPKVPFIAPKAAMEGHESDWAQIHLGRKPFYVYNHSDDNNQPIPPPQRVEPPAISSAYMNLMQVALQDLMLASGQYEANMGEKSNEISGKAVDARQRQGENSTYHFIARLGDALRNSAVQILELIQRIYDEEQVVKILMPDFATEQTIRVDPGMPQAHQDIHPDPSGESYTPDQLAYALNPTIGKYAVVADVGPSYATRRQEQFNALGQIIAHNQQALPLLGDLWLESADFPSSDEAAARMRRMLPPQAKEENKDPAVQQLQAQLAQQHQVMQKQASDIVAGKVDKEVEMKKLSIQEYDSETKRLAAVGNIDKDALMPIVRQLVSQVLGTAVNPVIAAHKQENEMMHGSDTYHTAHDHANTMESQENAQDAAKDVAKKAKVSK